MKPEPCIFDRTEVVATRLSLENGDSCKVITKEKTIVVEPGYKAANGNQYVVKFKTMMQFRTDDKYLQRPVKRV